MADKSVFLTSLQVYKKISDLTVSEMLGLLPSVKNESNQKLQETLENFIAASRPIDQNNVSAVDFINLATSSMVINGKIANKAISLRDQKVITKSNYTIIGIDDFFERENNPKVSSLIKRLAAPKEAYETFNVSDVIKSLNYEGLTVSSAINKLGSILGYSHNEVQEYIKAMETNPDAQDKKEVILESIQTRQELTEDWLDRIISITDGLGKDAFLGNYTIYRYGSSEELKPVKALVYNTSTRVTSSFIKKLSNANTKYKGAGSSDSYFEKTKNKDVKNIKGLALDISKNNSANLTNKTRTRNNTFISDLLNAGPDLYSNMFDIYFRFSSKPSHELVEVKKNTDATTSGGQVDDSSSNPKIEVNYLMMCPINKLKKTGKMNQNELGISEAMNSTFNKVYSLSVRTASVSIPTISRDSTQLKFLNTSIERSSTIVNQNLEGTISIDCDANTYVYDMFTSLAGLQRDGYIRKSASSNELEPIKNDYFDRVKGHYPFLAPAKLGWTMNTVDIVVSAHSLAQWSDKFVNSSAGAEYSNILYIFKDVRFLGVGNGIKFSNDSSASQACDVKFIARNLETYYKPDNFKATTVDNGNVVRSQTFNSRNLNGLYYDESSITEADE